MHVHVLFEILCHSYIVCRQKHKGDAEHEVTVEEGASIPSRYGLFPWCKNVCLVTENGSLTIVPGIFQWEKFMIT